MTKFLPTLMARQKIGGIVTRPRAGIGGVDHLNKRYRFCSATIPSINYERTVFSRVSKSITEIAIIIMTPFCEEIAIIVMTPFCDVCARRIYCTTHPPHHNWSPHYLTIPSQNSVEGYCVSSEGHCATATAWSP